MNIELNKIVAKIKISRIDSKSSNIEVDMPIQIFRHKNELIDIRLPLFNIDTFATSESDIDTAINEALKCFFDAATKFGAGIEKELAPLGWKVKGKTLRVKTSDMKRLDRLFTLKDDSNPALRNSLAWSQSKNVSFSLQD